MRISDGVLKSLHLDYWYDDWNGSQSDIVDYHSIDTEARSSNNVGEGNLSTDVIAETIQGDPEKHEPCLRHYLYGVQQQVLAIL